MQSVSNLGSKEPWSSLKSLPRLRWDFQECSANIQFIRIYPDTINIEQACPTYCTRAFFAQMDILICTPRLYKNKPGPGLNPHKTSKKIWTIIAHSKFFVKIFAHLIKRSDTHDIENTWDIWNNFIFYGLLFDSVQLGVNYLGWIWIRGVASGVKWWELSC